MSETITNRARSCRVGVLMLLAAGAIALAAWSIARLCLDGDPDSAPDASAVLRQLGTSAEYVERHPVGHEATVEARRIEARDACQQVKDCCKRDYEAAKAKAHADRNREIAKAKADLKAGKIDQQRYDRLAAEANAKFRAAEEKAFATMLRVEHEASAWYVQVASRYSDQKHENN